MPQTSLVSQQLDNMSKLPHFVSEQEEAEFWATHDSTEYLDDTEPVDVTFIDARPSDEQISLRLDAHVIEELKDVAFNPLSTSLCEGEEHHVPLPRRDGPGRWALIHSPAREKA